MSNTNSRAQSQCIGSHVTQSERIALHDNTSVAALRELFWRRGGDGDGVGCSKDDDDDIDSDNGGGGGGGAPPPPPPPPPPSSPPPPPSPPPPSSLRLSESILLD